MNVFKQWLPAIIWAAFIFILSSLSFQDTELPVFPFADKIAHLCLYTILGFFVSRGLASHNFASKKIIWLTIIITAIYGASDEFHQYFTPARSVEFLDFVSDGIGGFIGSILYGYKIRR